MRSFPLRERLDFLVGLELANVILQPYSLDFQFTDGTFVRAEHAIEYDDGDAVTIHNIQAQLGPITFHPLVRDQARVLDVEISNLRLSLIFPGRRKITIISDVGPYESGHITYRDQFIVF
jgi:hypothetical protein